MSSPASSFAAGRPEFPETCWSRLAVGGWKEGPGRREALEELARSYWKPIYACIRSRWAKTHHEAKDLTQDFFLWMMEGDFVEKADPGRGRFRGFVQVALKHYLLNRDRDDRREKRGGGRPVLALADDETWSGPVAPDKSPEQLLDQVWQSELLVRAASRLEDELRTEGKQKAFLVFREYFFGAGADEGGYAEVARKHGITEVDVANHLTRTKVRFRAILTDLVAQTVAGPEELQAELKSLFGDAP